MPKLKYDIRKSDPDKAKAAGAWVPPPPGIYPFQITECNQDFSKGDNGQPDKKRPRLEVVFSCRDARYSNAQVWLYLPTAESEARNDVTDQKWDQLLQAVGFTDGKRNRSGTLDTDKDLLNKMVRVRVRGGTRQGSDEYRAEFGSVMPYDGDDSASDEAISDDELSDEDEVVEDDEVMEEEELEDEGDGGLDVEARTTELKGMQVPELKAIAKKFDITIGGKTKATLIEAIIEAEAAELEGEAAADEEELMEEDEEIIEDEEEEASDYLTRDDIMAMERDELVATAKQFDIKPSGMKRSQVVEAILEAQAAPDDEEPF